MNTSVVIVGTGPTGLAATNLLGLLDYVPGPGFAIVLLEAFIAYNNDSNNLKWRNCMDDSELERLLIDLESDRVERKASISDRDKIRQTICAFANDYPNHQQPGILFVGVNDNGSCTNLSITDELLKNIADWKSNGNILPFPSMVVQKRTIHGCEMAVVIVEPSDDPPVRYRGRVWIRVGPRTETATAGEELRLAEKRHFKNIPFDIRPLSPATLDDLDDDLFARVYLPSSIADDVLEQNHRSIAQQYASLRFTSVEPQSIPTTLGILIVGQEPRRFISGDYIQFLRIDGTEWTDPIKYEKEIDGPLPNLIKNLDETF